MKTDVNGCSVCGIGSEQYEFFTLCGKERVQYDYRTPDGELFSCIAMDLDVARQRRNKWLKDRIDEGGDA